jgi:broad specificity phosphatase PhoE
MNVFMVRHGESEGNTGVRKAVMGVADIPLTDKGVAQAANFADSVISPPDLIVSSPFVRARNTAQFLKDKFPTVPCEIWEVYEFTYLNSDKCMGKTFKEREQLRNDFYQKMDPSYSDGNDAESFSDFLNRIRYFLKRLRNLDLKNIYVFTHGYFILMTQIVLNNDSEDDRILMMEFHRRYLNSEEIANGTAFQFIIDNKL